jgi:predicted nucleotidyltransferase
MTLKMYLLSEKRNKAEKTSRLWDKIKVKYSPHQWRLLAKYRSIAKKILRDLERRDISGYVHGSVSRGDVNEQSDIDIIIPSLVSTQKIELALALSNHKIHGRRITMATPKQALKGHIYLDPFQTSSVTFPLLNFKRQEYEFYKFGGMLDIKTLEKDIRTPGCTKQLLFIEPSQTGHYEISVEGKEKEISRLLNIGSDIVLERIRVLKRRDKIGRTGIFLKYDLFDDESFEKRVKTLMDTNPAIKRNYFQRVSNKNV